MNDFKLTTKTLAKLSMIVNKMGVSSLILELNEETGNENRDKSVIVKKLIALVIDNLYKAEDEITEFIAQLKGITKEEAQEVDIIPILKELLNNEKVAHFLNLT